MNTQLLQRLICWAFVALSSALLAGCASTPDRPVTSVSVKDMVVQDAVVARDIDSYGGILAPMGVADSLPNEGKVYFFVTTNWSDTAMKGGPQDVKWEWYTGEKVVSTFTTTLNFANSPDICVGYRPARLLGVGQHRARLYIKDRASGEYVLVAEKTFAITDIRK